MRCGLRVYGREITRISQFKNWTSIKYDDQRKIKEHTGELKSYVCACALVCALVCVCVCVCVSVYVCVYFRVACLRVYSCMLCVRVFVCVRVREGGA